MNPEFLSGVFDLTIWNKQDKILYSVPGPDQSSQYWVNKIKFCTVYQVQIWPLQYIRYQGRKKSSSLSRKANYRHFSQIVEIKSVVRIDDTSTMTIQKRNVSFNRNISFHISQYVNWKYREIHIGCAVSGIAPSLNSCEHIGKTNGSIFDTC